MKVTLNKADSVPEKEPLPGIRLETLPRLAVLVGPAGIGKTRFCLENFSRLLDESKPPFSKNLLYILPTAEHRERIVDLLLRKEGSGFLGERVTTLNRLMQELLKAWDFYLATDSERRFLLNEIISQKGGGYFSSVLGFPGFMEKVSDFVGELKESMINTSTLRRGLKALQKARPQIQDKYEGLLQICQTYEEKLEALGLKDHRDGLFLLRSVTETRRSKPPLFNHLFVDGFFDFSPSQLGFLGWLSERSERILLTLAADLSSERKGIFEIPFQTLKELEKLGFETVDLSREENRRTQSPSLRHVEKNLFCFPGTVLGGTGLAELKVSPSEPSPISILEATGIRGEAEMIAREIRRLVKKERMNFSDIAVILRRIGEYDAILRSVFKQFEIPVEIHERERLRDSPLARTLANFFRVLLGDWKREDLFNFLKSSYVDTDYNEVCRLEIQALRGGILSGRERWLKEIDSPLFEKISAFQDRFTGTHPVADFILLTMEVLASFGLTQIPEIYEAKARRDFAALKRIHSLFEEIRRSAYSRDTDSKTFEDFAHEFLGLMEVDLFSLHERDKNLVQVYDVSLARQKEYKVVFLAGLLEKHFPAEIREDPILSDEERRVVGLKERLPRQALERYLFYLGLTRAREKVILSYPRFDLEGHEALPSFYVAEVERLFSAPSIPKRSYPLSQSLPRLEDAVEERELEAHLIKRLWQRGRGAADRSERAFTVGLYNRFLQKDSFRQLIPRVFFDPVAKIESEAVRAAFLPKGEIFKPTGLETYGRCPYRYFASEILRLQENEEGINAMQVGILLHDVLESYWSERIQKGRKDLAELEAAKTFVKEKFEACLSKDPLSGDLGYRIELKKNEMLKWLLRMVEKEITEGSPLEPLGPRYFEYEFGFRRGKEHDYLTLHDPYRQDLKLRGKIDRIEVDPSGEYALVIDYKTGGEFKQAALNFGTALQLPLYLLAVREHLGLKPVGAQIYKINEAKTGGFYLKEGIDAVGADVGRSRSVYGRKEFDEILKRAVHFSFKYAEGIKKAEIPVRPRDCDTHCPFPSVCRIEKWKLRYIEQEIQEEDRKSGII